MPRYLIGTTSVYNYAKKGKDPLIILALHQEIPAENAEKDQEACESEAIEKLETALLTLLTPYLLNQSEEQQKDLVQWAKNHLEYHAIERAPLIGNNNEEVIRILSNGVASAYQSVLQFQTSHPTSRKTYEDSLEYDDIQSRHRSMSIIHRRSTQSPTEVKNILLISPCNLGYPNKKTFPLESPETIYTIMEPFRMGGKKGILPTTKCIWTAESVSIRNMANSKYSRLRPEHYTNPRGLSSREARLIGINNYFYAPLEIKSLMSYLDDWWGTGLRSKDKQITDEKNTKRKTSLTQQIHLHPDLEVASPIPSGRRTSLMEFVRQRLLDSSSEVKSRSASLPTYLKTNEEKSIASNRTSHSLSSIKDAVLKRFGMTKESKVLPVDSEEYVDRDDNLFSVKVSTSKRDSADSRRSSGGSNKRDRVAPLTEEQLDQLKFVNLWKKDDNFSESSEESKKDDDEYYEDSEEGSEDEDGRSYPH